VSRPVNRLHVTLRLTTRNVTLNIRVQQKNKCFELKHRSIYQFVHRHTLK